MDASKATAAAMWKVFDYASPQPPEEAARIFGEVLNDLGFEVAEANAVEKELDRICALVATFIKPCEKWMSGCECRNCVRADGVGDALNKIMEQPCPDPTSTPTTSASPKPSAHEPNAPADRSVPSSSRITPSSAPATTARLLALGRALKGLALAQQAMQHRVLATLHQAASPSTPKPTPSSVPGATAVLEQRST